MSGRQGHLDQIAVLHLRYFLAVLEDGTIRAAAERIGISQPSLSQQIGTLERRLGHALFERHPFGMHPTPAAADLELVARSAIAGLTSLRDGLGGAGPRIGIPRGLSSRLIAALVSRFGESASFSPLDTASAPAALAGGTVDVAVVRGPRSDRWQRLRVDRFAAAPLGVLLSDAHPLAGRATLDWPDLATQRLLWFDPSRAPAFADWLLGLVRRNGWDPELTVVDPGGTNLVTDALGRNRDLVALRPEPELMPPGLTWVPMTRPPVERLWLLNHDRTPDVTG